MSESNGSNFHKETTVITPEKDVSKKKNQDNTETTVFGDVYGCQR